MKILSAISALPPHYYSQGTLIEAFRKQWGARLERFTVLEKLHAAAQVDGRYLALPLESYPLKSWGEANNHWIDATMALGEEAVSKAMTAANVKPEDIGAFFFVSVTGVCSPSIESRLMNKMKLNPHTKRIPIFGLGCLAGAAGIARAADYVKAFPKQAALLLSVELCSLTVQPDDLSAANLISTGLFGDGGAAVVIAGNQCPGATNGPEIIDTRSTLYPDTQDVMGWDITEKGFRIILSREVPEVVMANLGRDVEGFLAGNGLKRSDIQNFVIHTGGPKVLDATEAALGLKKGALELSRACLRKTGNLSSASVLFVLEETMKNHRPAPGTYGILAAMGPAFCSELVLLKW